MPARWNRTARLPEPKMNWLSDDGEVVDLTAYDSFEIRIGTKNKPGVLIFTDGITGHDDLPNLRWTWPDEFSDLSSAAYTLTAVAFRVGDAEPRIVNDSLTISGIVEPALP